MFMRVGVVDVGSHTVRLVVADADGSDAREVRPDDLPEGWHWPLAWVSSNELAVHHRAPGAALALEVVLPRGSPRATVELDGLEVVARRIGPQVRFG